MFGFVLRFIRGILNAKSFPIFVCVLVALELKKAQDKNSRKLFLYTDNAVTGENISVMIPSFTTLKPSF